MEKKMKLQQLQEKHRELMEKRKQLDQEIQEHRQHLCPYCLNVVEEALREIGKGQDIVVLKRVNFCCSTYHSQQQQDCLSKCQRAVVGALGGSSNGNDNNIIGDTVIKNEPSEFDN
jgi:predicted metal-binding protein